MSSFYLWFQTEMLETEILCKYSEAVDGIQVAIDTDLDNVADEKK